jgi:hypothetical protein
VTEELFSDNPYAREKLARAKNILRETYYRESNFDRLVEVRAATAGETGFQQLYLRTMIPREWFTREDVVIDLAFEGFGTNLAHSEVQVIVNKIFSEPTIPKVDIGQHVREDVISQIQAFSANNKIGAMLIPLDLYVDMHTVWLEEAPDDIQMDIRTGNLAFGDLKPSIFWSNKYMPFDDIALIDKRFGQWVLKPNFAERLAVKIVESQEADKLDLSFFTTGRFEIANANRVLILSTPKPYLIV